MYNVTIICMKLRFNIFLLCFWLCTSVLAEEVLTENAEGVVLYSADENNSDEKPNQEQPSGWQAKTQEVIINALSLTGIKYKYGGNSPETGFDKQSIASASNVGKVLKREIIISPRKAVPLNV